MSARDGIASLIDNDAVSREGISMAHFGIAPSSLVRDPPPSAYYVCMYRIVYNCKGEEKILVGGLTVLR